MEENFVQSSVKNRLIKFLYATSGFFATKKKMDELNERNIEKSRERRELTVLLHGTCADYCSMYETVRLLSKYGVSAVSIGYDYKKPVEESSENFKNIAEELMKKTNVRKFNIIGVCLGGLVARYYAERLDGKKSIDKLVTIYSPLKPIPITEFGARINKLAGGNSEVYNRALKDIEGINSVKNHLFIYSLDDKIIKPKYSTRRGLNQLCLRGGHLLVSYNPEVLKVAADFIRRKN